MGKTIADGSDALNSMAKGIGLVADAIAVTYGPRGRCVALGRTLEAPAMTTSGIVAAREIELADPLENSGAQLMIEAATKTKSKVGDGTAVTIILADALVRAGRKLIAFGMDANGLRRGLDAACEASCEMLWKQAQAVESVEDLRKIATLSSGSNEIGNVVAEAYDAAGANGFISIEESPVVGVSCVVEDGIQFDRGMVTRYMADSDRTGEAVLKDASILIYNGKIATEAQIAPVLEKIVMTKAPLLVICEDIENEPLSLLLTNQRRGMIKSVVVKAPGFGMDRRGFMDDVAVATGGKVVDPDLGESLAFIAADVFGHAEKITVSSKSTSIVGGRGDDEAIKAYRKRLASQMENADSDYHFDQMRKRLARISEGMAVIRVGAATPMETRAMKEQVQGAMDAVKAALEEGMVVGEGKAYINALDGLDFVECDDDAEAAGVEMMRGALTAPFFNLVQNSGMDGATFLSRVKSFEEHEGVDFHSGDRTDLREAGIIDPVKVLRVALIAAVSTASVVLLSGGSVYTASNNE